MSEQEINFLTSSGHLTLDALSTVSKAFVMYIFQFAWMFVYSVQLVIQNYARGAKVIAFMHVVTVLCNDNVQLFQDLVFYFLHAKKLNFIDLT